MSSEAARAIESVLMVAQDPVDPHLLAQLLEVSPARVDELCSELQAAYVAEERGFVLVKVAGGYRFQSHPDLAAYVERFVLEGQTARLSAAALETLAIVAYKQPLSRAQIAAIRGVNVDGVLRTLQQRGYVAEVGRDTGPGQATLFGTTPELLERLGLDRIEDLPPIAQLFPAAEVLEALEQGLRAHPTDDEPTAADTLDLTDRAPAAEDESPRATDADRATEGHGPVGPDVLAELVGAEPSSGHGPDPGADPGAEPGGVADRPIDLDAEPPEPQPPAWAIDPPEPPES